MRAGKGGIAARVEDACRDFGLGDGATSGIIIIRIGNSEEGAIWGTVGGWGVQACTYRLKGPGEMSWRRVWNLRWSLDTIWVHRPWSETVGRSLWPDTWISFSSSHCSMGLKVSPKCSHSALKTQSQHPPQTPFWNG